VQYCASTGRGGSGGGGGSGKGGGIGGGSAGFCGMCVQAHPPSLATCSRQHCAHTPSVQSHCHDAVPAQLDPW
jgi:hypothetical protein